MLLGYLMLLRELKAYHGSNRDSVGFDVSHTGDNSHTFGEYKSTRYGTFFTDNKKVASEYGIPLEYELNINNTLKLDSKEGMEILWKFIELMMESNREVYLDASNVYSGHWSLWQLFEEDLGKHFTEFLSREGFDSVAFEEETTSGDDFIEGRTTVVFNPSRIIKNNQREFNLHPDVT